MRRMTVLTAILLLLATTTALGDEALCSASAASGRMAAKEDHRALAWYLFGIPTGMLGLHFGVAGLTLAAVITEPRAPSEERIPSDVDRECYVRGYSSRARSKNTLAALGGSTTGLFLIVLLVVSAYS